MTQRLIFFCPVKRKAVGGMKVIYQLAEECGRGLQSAGKAYVFHPNHPWFRCDWFQNDVDRLQAILGFEWRGKPSLTKLEKFLDPTTDFVVLPELWVRKYASQLLEMQVPYAILVQGGYLIGNGDPKELKKAYDGAEVILTNSEKSSQLVRYAYPSAVSKVERIYLKIDSAAFSPSSAKENLITYMPRRLPEHASYLKFLLHDRLPSNWKLLAIDKLSEREVASILSKSKIFLSFSDREGFGLPPIEAALAGNFVIGYTGEAGREYWKAPIFSEITQGDLLSMADTLMQHITHFDKLDHSAAAIVRDELTATYSESAFQQGVARFLSNHVIRHQIR